MVQIHIIYIWLTINLITFSFQLLQLDYHGYEISTPVYCLVNQHKYTYL